ncbi:hypothetical protein [Pinirhizobacter soli]|uniref:hypothetical protein n=1 Tax=Pinirhizobacter soli TaxID=2786953 RepID=UPI00202A22A3|nr:hypothetical protein [Pinirhizobacter soli]
MKQHFAWLCLAALALMPATSMAKGGHGGGYHAPRASGGYGTGSSTHVERVSGYVTRRGTYVAPHVQTTPNHTRLDNFSTKGNFNPYTGKFGTKPAWRKP